MTEVNAWWLPSDLRELISSQGTLTAGKVSVTVPHLDAAFMQSLAAELKKRQAAVLQSRSIASIVASLDAVAGLWLDDETPERQRALDVLPLVTGFSAEMVRESIELEQRSSRADHMWRALRSELGDPAMLDGFVKNGHLVGDGRTMALGPSLVGSVFSSNIPALPHLTVMRSLMVKSSFWGRVSAREPTFLPLYLETLSRVDPELASCCACLWWPVDDRGVEHAFLTGSDFFVGWGSAEVEDHFSSVLPPTTQSVFHGHRIGFAVVDSSRSSAATVEGLAVDVCRFDQQACLSPQAIFYRGSMADAVKFGQRLAAAMDGVNGRLPPRKLDGGEAMAVHQFRGSAELAPSFDGGALFTPPSGELDWTVAVERCPRFPVSPLHRCITVCQVDDWSAMTRVLEPIQPWLQNAALAVAEDDEGALRTGLARLGVSRLCVPGDMASPSMMWHHDGVACLAAMVRWCDQEDTWLHD